MINKATFLALISQQMMVKNPPEKMKDLADLAIAFGEYLDLSMEQIESLEIGAYIHDIGKLLIPDEILRYPGRLSASQWAVMRNHVTLGYEMVRQIPEIESASLITLYHHERWNGSGYPNGLRGDHIPFMVRVFSLCDVWTAFRSDRTYKSSFTVEESINLLSYERDTGLYDPELVEIFLKFVEAREAPKCEGKSRYRVA
ncbi:MAG: HD domain-containing protein [Timaviella obliquedivisa GSE-PSE-MK23-08B]|jgi:putative two-component system response regulator|nr:HD domain-containing protein [Timaviella obliquedivisa GSE-PSE-MK23-08B]